MILFFDFLPFHKRLDYNQTLTCQECGHFGRFEVYVIANRFRLFFIPLFTIGKHYAVRTTCCDTLYQLTPEKGRAIEKGQSVTISEEDLTLKELGVKATTRQCRQCGHTQAIGSNFCSNCGQPLT